ncbi:energy-coupling factor ABC transporter permease [Micromonospora sp. WMMA1363]|uniref:energy-coupling factor ABC transporter permease n=1 Tax=Micromonospora sp. WMMA1363 TaxID=3053985 RepID=UPI00259CB590|nr:energy-coupling factor ABC transporter permease [Micromonospora sp. WMMA1363]MDM4722715.1 energy-coupling factor ABC transporter permease [Micromonospora sp. WMMA1363]
METLALHISNGIINGPVAAVFAAIALAAMTFCVLRGRQDLDDRLVPLAGLVAAFVFAAQMLNFPIFTAAVSGHLIGGALAAILVGPWVGALCVAVVLIVQALVFGDGGVAMLGPNITNMALLGTAAAYLLIAVLLRILPRTTGGLAVTAFVSALFSVLVAAMGFVVQYQLGGTTDLGGNLAGLAGTMAVSHLLIGIGEGLITATTVVTVARVRPDLVYALRARKPVAAATVPAVGGVR